MKEGTFTAKVQDGYALFWHGIFSNFYPCKILDKEGHQFISSEQMFMYGKAVLFNDPEIAKKILKAETPKEAKALGRKVRGFDTPTWGKNKIRIMHDAVLKKFAQNEDLKQEILSDKYNEIHFVEASPLDRIWGIGYGVENALNVPKEKWGQNLLGKVLDMIRIDLLKHQS